MSYISMNIYRHRFVAKCPNNGEQIIYELEIQNRNRILIEHIKTCTAMIKCGFHEDIADELYDRFGGNHKLKALHDGVEIETVRSER